VVLSYNKISQAIEGLHRTRYDDNCSISIFAH